jgi:fibronectin type 3 domain-containing protein
VYLEIIDLEFNEIQNSFFLSFINNAKLNINPKTIELIMTNDSKRYVHGSVAHVSSTTSTRCHK